MTPMPSGSSRMNSSREPGRYVGRELRHLDGAFDAEAARGDDLEARLAEVRRELLRELLRVGRADRDPPRADRLERFDLAPDERDDGRARVALRPREELSLEAVALERHRRRAAEHDHVAFLVREIRDGGLVAREDPLELLGGETLQVERRGNDD